MRNRPKDVEVLFLAWYIQDHNLTNRGLRNLMPIPGLRINTEQPIGFSQYVPVMYMRGFRVRTLRPR